MPPTITTCHRTHNLSLALCHTEKGCSEPTSIKQKQSGPLYSLLSIVFFCHMEELRHKVAKS